MPILTVGQLEAITGNQVNQNGRALIGGLARYGAETGLNRPHRLAHFLAQIMHESMRLRHDEENMNYSAERIVQVWPSRFDSVADADRYARNPEALASRVYGSRMGNGPEATKDGWTYRGRTAIQLTGKSNYTAFTKWAQAFAPEAPDFVSDPDALLESAWEGLPPIWYWETNGLNTFADANNIETITRRINGGLNGFQDRVGLYTRCALVLLGHDANDVKGFQARAGLTVDGISGPNTRGALHAALEATKPAEAKATPAKPGPNQALAPLPAYRAPSVWVAGAVMAFSLLGFLGIDVEPILNLFGQEATAEGAVALAEDIAKAIEDGGRYDVAGILQSLVGVVGPPLLLWLRGAPNRRLTLVR